MMDWGVQFYFPSWFSAKALEKPKRILSQRIQLLLFRILSNFEEIVTGWLPMHGNDGNQ
jgi:hypothetical protein